MANININLGTSIIASNFSSASSDDTLQLASLVDMFFQASYGFDSAHYYYSSRSTSGSTMRINYADGAYSQFSGITLANPNASVGDASAMVLERVLPGYFSLNIGGNLNYHYDANQGSFYSTTSTVTDTTIRTMLATSNPEYDPTTGNVTIGMHGRVNVAQSDDFSGTLSSITLSAEKTLALATISGDFAVQGNGMLIGHELSSTQLTGRLDGVVINYRDGSSFSATGLGLAINGQTQLGDSMLANPANFSGDDVVNVTLASKLEQKLQLATGAGKDTIVLKGGAESVNLDAGSGNDTITLLDHNHIIDGGSGSDTVVLAGPRSSYQITQNGNNLTVQSKGFVGGIDTLSNVERLLFDDGAVAYDIAGNGGQVYRLYQAAFNRAPDAGGLGFWMHQMDEGMSLDAIASYFTTSSEFKTMYGSNLSNAALIDKLYQNVLHRAGDDGGIKFWNNYLDNQGGTQAKTLAYFGESAENQSALISVIGNGFSYTPYG